MELAIRLKENRNRIGLSQEEMADRIYVSRQTISNWETDRTYPDVQSLLLLSELFETSIDELVKGDVEIMEKAIENDWKTMSRLAVAGWGLTGVGIAALIVGFMLQSGPSSLSDKLTETEVLGLVLFLAFWILGMVVLGVVDYMKRKNDLVTYRDILAYSKGQEPVRDDSEFSRRHPLAVAWVKVAVVAVSGATVGIVLVRLFS